MTYIILKNTWKLQVLEIIYPNYAPLNLISFEEPFPKSDVNFHEIRHQKDILWILMETSGQTEPYDLMLTEDGPANKF